MQWRSPRRNRNLSRMLLVLGLPLLALGAYGIGLGIVTLTWPRTEAVILAARVDLRESTQAVPGTDKVRGGRTETRETASLHVRYRYRVGGLEHEGSGVEPADFGLRSSAAARELGKVYAPGLNVRVAYQPGNPANSFLRPGPSSPALMLAIVGNILVLLGVWLRRR